MSRLSTGRAGAVLLATIVAGALVSPWLATNHPSRQFPDHVSAPPMLPRILDDRGRLRAPFVYPLVMVDRLERRYREDRTRPIPLEWFQRGVLASVDDAAGPWLPLGADPLGRDVFARLLLGGRPSLGIAFVAALGALLLGIGVGAVAGAAGGRLDDGLMRIADVVVALPAIYVVLALRASLPLVLTPGQVFWAVGAVLALAGWPFVARGVRAVVAAERRSEYAEAARALGASRVRILLRHILPAARGLLAVQTTMLVPAFILAEATLSFVGLGFPDPAATWGVMLRDAGRGRAFAEAPWLLAPAAMIVLTVLGVHLVAAGSRAHHAAAASRT
jgi:peptide/nickel transport system permease protein